jgi:gamma-F420-2:alpha-L-glutamate ligase
MRAWLIYDRFEAKRNKDYVGFYFKECGKRNIELHLLIYEEISMGMEGGRCVLFYRRSRMEAPDFAICRVREPLLSRHLEMMGIPVFNNYQVSSICNDKRMTYQYVSSAGVRMMDAIFCDTGYRGEIAFPAVVKPSGGKGGKHVYLVRDMEEYLGAVNTMPKSPIVIQRVADNPGKDLRVYVIGRRILASMLRISDSDFRSNFCLGGRAEEYRLSIEETAVVNRIIDLFNFGFVGIDFVFDSGGMVFNEIEDVVGSRMLYSKTSINVVSEYLDFILSRIEGR